MVYEDLCRVFWFSKWEVKKVEKLRKYHLRLFDLDWCKSRQPHIVLVQHLSSCKLYHGTAVSLNPLLVQTMTSSPKNTLRHSFRDPSHSSPPPPPLALMVLINAEALLVVGFIGGEVIGVCFLLACGTYICVLHLWKGLLSSRPSRRIWFSTSARFLLLVFHD